MQMVIIGNREIDWDILGKPMREYVEELAKDTEAENLNPDQDIVILSDDMPLVTEELISGLLSEHREKGNALTVFGQIYLAKGKVFLECMQKANVKELTVETLDGILEEFQKGWYKCSRYEASEDIRANHINTQVKLAQAISILRQRINKKLMENGVFIIDPSNTYIGPDVQISKGCMIKPGTYMEGQTVVGKNCVIGPNTTLKNVNLGNDVEISFSVASNAEIGNGTVVGPFAYIRPDSNIGGNCKIGNFVEVKNSIIGDNTKASHLTYIGDADVGNNINFGCGSVIVNYDGKNKHRTTIEDNVFIGCNTNLVAPVIVKNGAYTAAGSTITNNVPEQSLAIARARQINKEDWHKK